MTRKTAVRINIFLSGMLSGFIGCVAYNIVPWWCSLALATMTGAIVGVLFNKAWPPE